MTGNVRRWEHPRGVVWHDQAQKWEARINEKGRRIYLGHFDDVDAASAAYRAACIARNRDPDPPQRREPRRDWLARITNSHQVLAQLLAGGATVAEAAALTGYSPPYISRIKYDHEFQKLLAHYSALGAQAYVDIMQRMQTLGLSTLDELQARMEAGPSSFSNRELMELADRLLIKPKRAAEAGAAAGVARGALM